MKNIAAEKILSAWLLGSFLLVLLVVTPWFSYDPIASPKFAILLCGGGALLFLWVYAFSEMKKRDFRPTVILSVVFVIDLMAVLVFSGTNTSQEIFGAYGRKAGLLAQVTFVIFFISAVIVSSQSFLRKFSFAFCGLGLMSLIYGFIQDIGWDPAPWALIYSPVFGFTGNPNFQSALLGIVATWIFSILISTDRNSLQKSILTACVLLFLYGIYITGSIQGFFCFTVGVFVALVILMTRSTKISIIFVYLFSSTMALLGFFLFRQFFWNNPSILIRREYWAAAINMLQTHPLFGVGIESYGDWYRRERSTRALSISNGTWSNSSHNVVLDYAAWGGFPLLIIYMLFIGLTIFSAARLINRRDSSDLFSIPLIAAWFAYQAVSLISPNQVGMLLIGWILSGLVIGLEISTRKSPTEKIKAKIPRSMSPQKKTFPIAISLCGALAGLFFGYPQYAVTANFLSALNSSDARRIVMATTQHPIECERVFQTLRILKANKLNQNAIELAKANTSQCVDSYELWAELIDVEGISTEDALVAKRQMKRLEPLLTK